MKAQEKLEEILNELESGTKCILLHVNADPDALGSAIALSCAFPECTIGTVGGLNKNGKMLQKNLDIDVMENPDISKFDKIVIVDTPSPERLGEYKDKLKDPIIMDHHSENFEWKTGLCFVNEDFTSCAEIVYEALKLGRKKITSKIALALLAGILTDTGKFSYANAGTLKTFGEIMQAACVTMDEVMSLFAQEHETDYSKKISRLKGAQRLRYQTVNRYIIAISQVSSFEASVCGALLLLGADCAFVGSQRENEFRISARATPPLVKGGLHLGNLLADIGEESRCDGGGHDGAAGIFGTGDVEAMLNICTERTKVVLKAFSRD